MTTDLTIAITATQPPAKVLALSTDQARALTESLVHRFHHAMQIPHDLALMALARYQEPGRHYHDLRHIERMVTLLRGERAADPQLSTQDVSMAQGLAILFHDAVYVPGAPRGMNETLSAHLLQQYGYGRVPEWMLSEAAQIILDTITHEATLESSRLVLDLDLSGLAGPYDAFTYDSCAVFEEVRHRVAGWDDFVQRRARFFAGLLARDALYTSGHFPPTFEVRARENLQQACRDAGILVEKGQALSRPRG